MVPKIQSTWKIWMLKNSSSLSWIRRAIKYLRRNIAVVLMMQKWSLHSHKIKERFMDIIKWRFGQKKEVLELSHLFPQITRFFHSWWPGSTPGTRKSQRGAPKVLIPCNRETETRVFMMRRAHFLRLGGALLLGEYFCDERERKNFKPHAKAGSAT